MFAHMKSMKMQIKVCGLVWLTLRNGSISQYSAWRI